MRPNWMLRCTKGPKVSEVKCLECGKKFTTYLDGHLNMQLVRHPSFPSEVWVPECPNGCRPFITYGSTFIGGQKGQ